MLSISADLVLPGDVTWNVRDAVVQTCSRVLQKLQVSRELSSSHATSILSSTNTDDISNGLSTLSRAQKRRVVEDVEKVQRSLRDLWEKTIETVETDMHELLLHLPLESAEDMQRDGTWLATLFEHARQNKGIEVAVLAAQQRLVDLKLRLERSETERRMLEAQDARHRCTTAYVMGTLLKQISTLTRTLEETLGTIDTSGPLGSSLPESVVHSFDSLHSAHVSPSRQTPRAALPPPLAGDVHGAATSFNAVCLFDFVEYLEEFAQGGNDKKVPGKNGLLAARQDERTRGVAADLGPQRLNELLERFSAIMDDQPAHQTGWSSARDPGPHGGGGGGGAAKKLLGQIEVLESSVREATKKVQLSSEKLDNDRTLMQLALAQRLQELKCAREQSAELQRVINNLEDELAAQKHKFAVFEHQLEYQRVQLNAQISDRERHVQEAEQHIEAERSKINKLLERMARGELSTEGLDEDDLDDNIVQDYLRSAKELKRIQEDHAALLEQHEAVKLDWAASEMTVGKCKDLLRLCCVRLYRAGITPDARVRDMLGESGSVGISEESLALIAAAQKQELDAANCALLKDELKPQCASLKAMVRSAFDFLDECSTCEDIEALMNKSQQLKKKKSFAVHNTAQPNRPQQLFADGSMSTEGKPSFPPFDAVWNDDSALPSSKNVVMPDRSRSSSTATIDDRRRSSSVVAVEMQQNSLQDQLKVAVEPDQEVAELLEYFPRFGHVLSSLIERQKEHWESCSSVIRRLAGEGQDLRQAIVVLRSQIPRHKLPDLGAKANMDADLVKELEDFIANDRAAAGAALQTAERGTSTSGLIDVDEAETQTSSSAGNTSTGGGQHQAVQCDLKPNRANVHTQTDSMPSDIIPVDDIGAPASHKAGDENDTSNSSPLITTTAVVQQYMNILTSTSMRFAPGAPSPLEARRSTLHAGGLPLAAINAGDDFAGLQRVESMIAPSSMVPERVVCHSCGVIIRRGSTVDGGLPLVVRHTGTQANILGNGEAAPLIQTADASTMCDDIVAKGPLATVGDDAPTPAARVRSAGVRLPQVTITTTADNPRKPTSDIAVQTIAPCVDRQELPETLLSHGAPPTVEDKDIMSELSHTRHFSRTGSARSRISNRSDSDTPAASFKPIDDDEDVAWMVDDHAAVHENPRLTSAMSRRISSLCGIPSVPMPQRLDDAPLQVVASHPSKLGGALIGLPNPSPQQTTSCRGALVPRSTLRISRARAAAVRSTRLESGQQLAIVGREEQQQQCSRALVHGDSSRQRGGHTPPPAMFHHRFPAHTPPSSIPPQPRPAASPDQQVVPVAYIHEAFVDTFGCPPSVMLHNKRNIADLAVTASRVHSASSTRLSSPASPSSHQPARAASASASISRLHQ